MAKANKKVYSFSDHPEHQGQLESWRDKWIANALNCEPMTDADREATRVAVSGLHEAAGLPAPDRVIFVESPLVGAVAASIASGAWWLRENPDEAMKRFGRRIDESELMLAVGRAAYECTDRCIRSYRGEPVMVAATDAATGAATGAATHAATYAATYAATHAATGAATYAATRAATGAATDAATGAATGAATDAATGAATHAATDAATDAATHAATYAATYAATHAATGAATHAATGAATHAAKEFLIACSVHWSKFWNGGNMWSGWTSYLSFFRHVAELPIDYSKWQHYEAAAVHAGPRFMHRRFCIVSDRPMFVHRDNASRPHRVDGPHIRWRDGVELHHIHGVRVTPKITAGDFTARDVLEQTNAEVRRVMLGRYNLDDPGRWIRDIGATPIHSDVDWMGKPRALYQIQQPDDEPYTMIQVTNSTPEPDGHRKEYWHRVDPQLRPLDRADARPQEMTCHNAIASGYRKYGHEYQPILET